MKTAGSLSILLTFLLCAFGATSRPMLSPADTLLMHQYVQIADSLEQRGQYDSCLVYYQKAYQVAESLERWQPAIEHAASISYFYSALERPEEERRWAWRVKDIAETYFGGSGENAGLAFNTLGTFYSNRGNQDSALFYYRQALEFYAQSRGRYNPEIIGIYQNLTNAYKSKRAYGKARDIFEEGLKTERQLGDSIPFPFAFYYNAGAQVYELLDRYQEAVALYQKALEVLKKTPDHPERASSLYGLAKIYREKGYYEEALEQFTQVLEMDLRAFGESHSYVIVDYQSLSMTYLMMGEYENARLYAQKALDLSKQLKGTKAPDNGSLMVSLAHALDQLGRREEAIGLVRQAIELERAAWGEQHQLVGIHTGMLAGMYGEQGALQKAINLQRRGLRILESLPAPPPSHVSDAYAALGRLHHRSGDHRSALTFFQREQALLSGFLRADHPHVADNHRNQAVQYLALDQADEANEHIRKAVALLLPEGEQLPDSGIPAPAQLREVNIRSAMSLYEVMLAFADILRKQAKDPASLRPALSCYDRALLLRERLFSQLRTEAARLISRSDSRRFFEAAIDLVFDLYGQTGEEAYAEQAFLLMEKSKAAVLRASLRDRRAMAFAGIPDSVLRRERRLKADINFASQKVHDLQHTLLPEKQEELSFWKQTLFSAQQAYQEWVSKLEKQHPAYYRLKYDSETPGLRAVQRQLLDRESALVSFFLGDQNLYACFVHAGGVELYKKELDDKFSGRLQNLVRLLRDDQLAMEKGNDKAVFDQFREEGRYFFRQLLGPVEPVIPQNLIIIPDGPLGLLPFELLLTEEEEAETVDYGALPYLLKKVSIRYAYAAGLLMNAGRQAATPLRLLAVAPAYGQQPLAASRTAYAALQFARAEAEAVSALSDGDLLAGSRATERQFKQSAGDYNLLHLATHTYIDTLDPLFSGLVLSAAPDSSEDHILRAYELYNLSLPTELVVLSACHTGSGQVAPGEGVMSLARAFRYAGSPNIVMSLWQVDDQTTRRLMTAFYGYLEKGHGKAAALRLAKLDYLQQQRKTIPYFWGAFVLLGDDEPVAFGSAFSWWWGVAAGIGLLGLGVWRRRRR